VAYSYSDEAVVDVNTNAQSLFEHLDDQARLASHMGERSMMMMVEYDLPASLFGWVAGRLFAPMYSRWCVKRMATDAARHFAA
jgi:hypothetical protein